MARRLDHNREELYEMALEAAGDIVESDGVRARTARNVADVIGYSRDRLYDPFVNLDESIVHLNGGALVGMHDRLSKVSSSDMIHIIGVSPLIVIPGQYI